MSDNVADVDFQTDDEVGLFLDNAPPEQEPTLDIPQDDIDALFSAQTVDAEKQYITFTINDEEYGTPILTVQEIRGWMKTTPLPNMPAYVRGVTNLRGNIVPVFDMRARFNGKMTEVTERHVVIMAQMGARTIGLLVDAISDILMIDTPQIQPPPVGSLTIDVQYLDGLFATDERMVALVNIDKLFDSELLENLPLSSHSDAAQEG